MERDLEEELALRDRYIVGLEKEGKLKDELIAVQKEIITSHEEYIEKLTDMLNEFL